MRILLRWLFLFHFLASSALCGDWPTYQHDNRRSGITEEIIRPPLGVLWIHEPVAGPEPAWPKPAKNDYWHRKRELNPRVIYDRAYHAVADGRRVYFCSSGDDRVCALSQEVGTEVWSFFAEAPMRLAPTLFQDRVYAGSDDGAVYCLRAKNGELVWKYKPDEAKPWVIGNGRMCSIAPVRTGVLVSKGVLYFCSGVFPLEHVSLNALKAATGRPLWQKSHSFSPQGYLLATKDQLLIPTGRTSPFAFKLKDGEFLGKTKGSAGSYAMIWKDALVYGPGDGGSLGMSLIDDRGQLASFSGLHMLIKGNTAFLHSKTRLSAWDWETYLELLKKKQGLVQVRNKLQKAKDPKKKQMEQKLNKEIAGMHQDMQGCLLWERACHFPYALIMAGEHLILGGEDAVGMVRARDGEELWRGVTPGRAYGLAVAHGKLFVSTDDGVIHCFGGKVQ